MDPMGMPQMQLAASSLRCFLCLTFIAGLWNLLMGVLCLLTLGMDSESGATADR